ncbi:MAG: aminoacyl-tRNA hydrolase [Betaproteobacteria bacterium]|nr:MAG: aminoacyl-tRNA hydrolase [Betaproteobacteria bacterium]
MKLLVGLGNPGKKYERTRHNAGFWLVERFAVQTGTALRKDAKFQALVGRHEPTGVWLLLPQSYMNSSGRPLQMLAGFFKISPAEMLVVHDDLDFAPGVARIKQGGGIAGHNGLRDISARLGSHDYWRLRIGIGHPGDRQSVADYVLDKPSTEDRAQIDAAMERALEALPLMLAGDVQGAMLKLHTQEKAQEKARPAEPAAKPAQADKPEKTGKAAPAEVVVKAGKNATTGKTEKTEKESALKSLFKKFLPDSGRSGKK